MKLGKIILEILDMLSFKTDIILYSRSFTKRWT